eukprot:Gb_03920 [translate_table: standard]
MNHSLRCSEEQGQHILASDVSNARLQITNQFEDNRPLEDPRYHNPMFFSQQCSFATRSQGPEPKPQRMNIRPANSNAVIHDYLPGFNLSSNFSHIQPECLNSLGIRSISSNFSQNQPECLNPLGPECLNSLGIRSIGIDESVLASSSFLKYYFYSGADQVMPPGGLMQGYMSDSARLLGQHGLTFVNNNSCRGSLDEVDDKDVQAGIGLDLDGRRCFAGIQDHTSEYLNRYFYSRPLGMSSAASQIPRCQAEGCRANLTNAKHYHRRHKVCELHSKASSVIAGGLVQRFCQQCSRFHIISEFDEGKRSCRKRLAEHNRRRRKPRPNSSTAAQTRAIKYQNDLDSNQMSHATGQLQPPMMGTLDTQTNMHITVKQSSPLLVQQNCTDFPGSCEKHSEGTRQHDLNTYLSSPRGITCFGNRSQSTGLELAIALLNSGDRRRQLEVANGLPTSNGYLYRLYNNTWLGL